MTGTEDMSAYEEAAKAVPLLGERTLTFTRRYKVVTTLTDQDLIARAQLFALFIPSAPTPRSAVEAIDLIIRIMTELKIGAPAQMTIKPHSSQIDEKDPGDF